MDKEELVREIKRWIKDYEDSQPKEVCIDYEDTFDGSAYLLLSKAVRLLTTKCDQCGKEISESVYKKRKGFCLECEKTFYR